MTGLSINPELKYLAELIEDFPPNKKISVQEAFEEIKVRYENLEAHIDGFLTFLEDLPIEKMNRILPGVIDDEDYFPAGMKLVMMLAHLFLFKDIVNNAGQIRQTTDPHKGRVFYGGLSNREIGRYKFYGSNPDRIEDELNYAFTYLKKKTNEPVKSGLEFYRRFVGIHPFYEANGRIARLMLTIYLQYHNYYIVWREIDSKCKGKFLSKLNSCHIHEGKITYEKYFKYFVYFMEPFIKPIAELKKI